VTFLLLALALLVALPEPSAVWPTTVAGWFTLGGVIIGVGGTIIGSFITYGKFLAKLNGFGERVGLVEKEQSAAKERDELLARTMERMTYAQEQLFKEIGEAKQQSGGCVTDMQDFSLAIGSKIDEFRREFNAEMRHAGERLQAVETEIKLTRSPARRGD
jgi:hypothetical protein